MSLFRRFLLSSLVLLGLLVVLGGAYFPTSPSDEPIAPVANGVESSREAALALIQQARQMGETVRDYRCLLTTRERLRGQLMPEQVMDMEFRVQPFAVHLKFRQPTTSAGQEVWFGTGLHAGQLRVRPAGYLGSLTGMMLLDPHSPTVRENSRHAITDAGMSHMLERFVVAWAPHPASVSVGTSLVDGRACRRIEVVLGVEAEWQRAMLHIDERLNLPVRVEWYDSNGRLLDEATYRNVEINIGLSDASFGG